jgi:iron complex outermembrane recepter protein
MFRSCRFVASLFAATVSFPALAQSQVALQPDAYEGDGGAIVVTAARSVLPASALPMTIDVIGKDDLDQQIAISGSVTDAVAALTPSFSPTRQKLSGAGETLRGRSPLYAINGIPQSTPLRDGSRDGFTIDGFFVDRVELIYGSNALQGIGGTGGIVNQVTVGAPTEEGVSGRTLLQGSADNGFDEEGFGGKAAGLVQYKADRFDASLGAAYEKRGVFFDGDGRRVGLNLTQGETQDSKAISLFGRFGYRLGDTGRIDLIVSHFDLKSDGDYVPVAGNKRAGLPTSAARGATILKPARSRTDSVALSFTDSNLAGGDFVSQFFFNRSRDTFGGDPSAQTSFQDARIKPVGQLFDQSQNRSRKLGAKFSYERAVPGWEALTGTLGLDLLKDRTEQRLIATGRVWVPPTDFRDIAPFAQFNLALFDERLRLAGGVRWENVQIKIDDYVTIATTTTPRGGVAVAGGKPRFDDVLLNGGVILEPWQGIRAYASYAEGFTVPDVGRITRAIGQPGVDIDTYLDISPIISNNREVGFELKRGPVDASVAYFWSSSDKGQLLIQNSLLTFDVQRQRVEIEGVEINAAVKLPIEGLKVGIGYAHLKGRYDGSTVPDGKVDTDLDGVNISPDRLNLSADFIRGPITARVQTSFFLSRTFHSDINPATGRPVVALDPFNDFGGYDLTDASIRYQTERLGGITLAVQNLFDRQYLDYSSDTRLPNDNFANFAGRGRTFTLSWDYRF